MSITAAVAIDVFTRLFKLGLDGWDALREDGFDAKDLGVLNDMLGAAGDALGGRGQEVPRAAAQHVALVLAAFGRAYARHWVTTRTLERPGWLRRWLDGDERKRRQDIEARMRMADLHVASVGEGTPGVRAYEAAAQLGGSPLATRYYRELWRVFSDPGLDDVLPGDEPVLQLVSGRDKHAFERDFLLAYHEALKSRAFEDVRAYLASLASHRERLVHEILLADLATWDRRHVFGNVPSVPEGEPFLPLADMYVAPDATVGEPSETTPVLELLHAWLDDPKAPHVTVVKADFGMGKSLSARMLARRLAARYLDEIEQVSLDTWLPVFIQCSTDFHGDNDSLASLTQRACRRQMKDIDSSAVVEPGAAFAREQRVLYILDGLDEVVLGQRALEGLFRRLYEQTHERHRVLVLSRPGVLPEARELEQAQVVTLQPFTDDHITAWLEAWNRLGNTNSALAISDIRSRGLLDLARTPILLFMIADTWSQHLGATPSLARLYETFCMQRARGKHERDRVQHRPVYDAALRMHTCLYKQGVLTEDATPEDAMLWLLARLAWEECTLAWKHFIERRMSGAPEESESAVFLTRRVVDNLLQDTFDLDDQAAQTILVGVLLVLQHDPSAGRIHIHFGHKSFREFLVARYVSDRLLALVRGHDRDWQEYRDQLLGARLLLPEDQSFEFLCELLSDEDSRPASPFAWTDPLRHKLRDHMERWFNDEEQLFPAQGKRESRRRIQDDQSAILREAALAIGSHLGELLERQPSIRPDSPWTLRSLLAWFWAVREPVLIYAPHAELPGMQAANVTFHWAVFRGANLRGAEFDGANLEVGVLADANLEYATFFDAILVRANLERANLVGAYLGYADLDEANLDEANLDEADLERANLARANLARANLARANLERANLVGANLVGANLERANLAGARYDCATRWPDGSDPEAAGAVPDPE